MSENDIEPETGSAIALRVMAHCETVTTTLASALTELTRTRNLSNENVELKRRVEALERRLDSASRDSAPPPSMSSQRSNERLVEMLLPVLVRQLGLPDVGTGKPPSVGLPAQPASAPTTETFQPNRRRNGRSPRSVEKADG